MSAPAIISKDFGYQKPIIQRSDGLKVDVSLVPGILESDRSIVKAMFYLKIIELTPSQLEAFVEYLLANLLLSINSKMSAERIKILRFEFVLDLTCSSPQLSVQEVKLICYNGIRGKYNKEPLDSNLTTANYYKWMRGYSEEKQSALSRVIAAVSFTPSETLFDFSITINQINEIYSLRKNKEEHESQCLRFSKTMPSFIYDKLIQIKLLKEGAFEKNIDLAKESTKHKSEVDQNNIHELIEVLCGVDFNNFNEKINSIAKQITIYNFIKNLKKPIK